MKSQYEIVVPYEQQQESNEPQLQNAEDCHRYAMFVKGNDNLKNDRTYDFIDEDGNYVSCFVSQYSDITLVTNTNKNVPNRFFRFHDCFPISISGLQLESGADADPVTTTVEFRFGYYEIESVS